MSTSPNQVLTEPGGRQSSRFQPFPYDVVAFDAPVFPEHPSVATESDGAEFAAREARVLAQGRQEGEINARKTCEERIAKERSSLAAALTQFARDRAAYFQQVESEVVQLALAIARKILHREAQVDPLLLAGIVRVALEKIDGASEVVLRVHPQKSADWQKYLSTSLPPAGLPQIIADPAQPCDQCALETSMGTATIGLEVQLKEVEQGLMDLLAVRPGVSL